MNTEWKTTHPARYYAAYDRTAAQPTPVTGWYDAAFYRDISHLPPAEVLLPLTPEEWASRKAVGHGVRGGKLVEHTQARAAPLSDRAAQALRLARQVVWDEYGSLGIAPPPQWVDYQKTLRAIADGADATGPGLPPAPAIA
ncbi:hypothetical protein CFR73_09815 [Novacetimonas maltaceti]|nr:hypothetical protein CFR73_09815 [Novacetimonas maltaceti]